MGGGGGGGGGGKGVHTVANWLKRHVWGMKNEEEKLHVNMTENVWVFSPTLEGVAVAAPTTWKKAAV